MRIVVAVDGSPQSTQAIQVLAQFGPLKEVTLVHAIALPDLDHPMITPELRDSVLQEVETKLRAEGEQLLDQIIPTLPSNCQTIHRINQIGSPSTVILETAKSAQADLIILGARGLSPVKELLLGSVSHRVVLHASSPTLVMRAPFAHLNHILIPVEGREDAHHILKFLESVSFQTPPRISIMTIWPQPRWPWPVTLGQSKLLEERALEHAQDLVDQIAMEIRAKGMDATGVVGLGDPAFAILEQAKSLQPDLIIMGSHGRKGISRFLLGSVSHSLIHHAPCAIVVVR